MVLDRTRGRVDPLLTVIAKRFTAINPNLLTWFALLFSVIAGGFFYLSNPLTELQNYFLFLPLFSSFSTACLMQLTERLQN